VGSAAAKVNSAELEARAVMPIALDDASKFILVSKDASDCGSVSTTAPLKTNGGVLLITQSVAAEAATGIVPRADSAPLLKVTFEADGADGLVTSIVPECNGWTLAGPLNSISLQEGQKKTITVSLNTSAASDGELVMAEILAIGIDSSFASVEIVGPPARAYVAAPPPSVIIDGAFADWAGRVSLDQDSSTVSVPSVDITGVGNASDSMDSYFYISVSGEICSGTYVPAAVARPMSSGGGSVVPARHTAEDTLTIFVDSDRSSATGLAVASGSKIIGADQKIEVKGLFGRIISQKMYAYSAWTSSWQLSALSVDAAKDQNRIELGVSSSGLGGTSEIDFIIQTTSWKGLEDSAVFDPDSMAPGTRAWVVEPAVGSSYATSMSYQRKMFYDGVNYWSFYFDGANTVCKYSTDLGQTWTMRGRVFATAGVNETSVWYDPAASAVYAVGDTSAPTTTVPVQAGMVDPSAHSITWLASDSTVAVSSFPLAGKNTFISKDASGYLWILSSNLTSNAAANYQLSAFVSAAAGSVANWAFSGNMLPAAYAEPNLKGSIVPAGSGNGVWAVYGYGGNVASNRYNGAWQPQQTIYAQTGNRVNTDNSPPSAVVDSKGVVHVVYGTSRKTGKVSIPMIQYSRNVTGSDAFTAGVDLDASLPAGIGDFFPTITLDSSTDDLHVLWLRGDATNTPRTVMWAECAGSVWSFNAVASQSSNAKMFLTSTYSAPSQFSLCWQWTENVTAPIEVLFDGPVIPEFSSLALPAVGFAALFLISMRSVKRSRRHPSD